MTNESPIRLGLPGPLSAEQREKMERLKSAAEGLLSRYRETIAEINTRTEFLYLSRLRCEQLREMFLLRPEETSCITELQTREMQVKALDERLGLSREQLGRMSLDLGKNAVAIIGHIQELAKPLQRRISAMIYKQIEPFYHNAVEAWGIADSCDAATAMELFLRPVNPAGDELGEAQMQQALSLLQAALAGDPVFEFPGEEPPRGTRYKRDTRIARPA